MPGLDEISLFVERLEAIGAPYMITGATAAILYGQPRVTNDLDVVLSQFIIATHSPILMAYPEATIYSVGDHGLAPIRYEDTEHYALTRRFLNDTASMLEKLLR